VAITVTEARELVIEFCRLYPMAARLGYRIRDTTEELYGDRGKGLDMLGGYITGPGIHPGRCEIPCGNARNANDFIATLRHEVIGHFGINSFTRYQKNSLLESLIKAQLEPAVHNLWKQVGAHNANMSETMMAEEVFALYCEDIEPGHHINQKNVHQRGEQSFRETCIERRLLQLDDLDNITLMVAEGLHDRTRTQQNFPELNKQFRQENRMKTKEPKKPFHEVVAEKLIEQLKAGTAPWQRPWEPGGSMPMNPTTGKRYRGINAIYLMSQGRTDSRWMTYKQAIGEDAQVRKGEKGTPVQYWKFSEEKNKLDDNGKPVLDEQGKPVKINVHLERPRVFFATVFNGEQIDGLPVLERKEQMWNAVERAEQILQASGASIRHSDSNRAYYRQSTDSIHLPDKGQFPGADSYYATALHELGHWTGHPSRLDRDLAHPFGSEGYAKEELVAEIASMILGDELGIGHDPDQHAAYVGSWIKALEDDPLEISRASSKAEKVQEFVLAFEQKQIQEQDNTQTQGNKMQQLHKEHQALLLDKFSVAEKTNIERAADARRQQAAGEINSQEFEAIAKASLGLDLPADWDGLTRVQGNGSEPEMWSVYAQRTNGTHQKVADFDSLNQADELAERFALVDAIAEPNTHEKSVKLARVQEMRVRRDPNSTDDQISAAKEFRKDLEVSATLAPFLSPSTNTSAKRQATVTSDAVARNQNRVYLAVPYGERKAADAVGAVWDKLAKSWYVGPKGEMEKLQRWLPDNVARQQERAMAPEQEFGEALISMGCILDADPKMQHPVMDGNSHRINVEGDRKGEQSGFYVGHLDGHPAGYIKNNRTGIDIKWKSKGYVFSPQEKAKFQAEAAEKLAKRAAERERQQEAAAQRVSQQTKNLVPVVTPTPYMLDKGIKPLAGVLTDAEGHKTYIPATDANGKQWSMQYIQEDGTKRFAKESRKEGCFHAVGGIEAVAAAPVLVITEGYATGATLAETLGHGTVAAFDSGNLSAVAQKLHAKFPNKPIIIAGDDDRHLEATQGTNPGKVKALEAAKITGGKAIFPVFAPGEAIYPTDLKPVTPQTYREHQRVTKALESGHLTEQQTADLRRGQLSAEQLNALKSMKQHTDFNDLDHKSELGREGVTRQVRAAVGKSVAEAERAHAKEQRQEKKEQKYGARIG